MENWPLHITLADVFAINLLQSEIELKLANLVSGQPSINAFAEQETTLGNAKVVLINNSNQLNTLHIKLVDLLESSGTIINTPERTRAGFKPHCTIQNAKRLHSGDEITIDQIALIDMFHNQNWQQRKVIKTFDFNIVDFRQTIIKQINFI